MVILRLGICVTDAIYYQDFMQVEMLRSLDKDQVVPAFVKYVTLYTGVH